MSENYLCTYLCTKNFICNFALIMRKATTTITPMLLKTRAKGDTYQIVIRINHNGRYYLNVGNIYAKDSDWDDKQHRLKRKYPNSSVINKIISDKVYEIEQRLYSFTTNGKSFTAKELCQTQHSLTTNIDDLANAMVIDKNLTYGSAHNYNTTFRRLKTYMGRNSINITDLNASTLRKWADYMKNTMHYADGTIQISLCHIAALWNYAISKRLASRSQYPMDEWKYLSDYRQKPHHIALSYAQITLLNNYFKDNYVVVDSTNNTWDYVNSTNHISLKHKELYISLFLIGYRMQGLALADLLSLRTEMLSLKSYKGKEYLVINGLKRQKTGVSVEVVVEIDNTFKFLFNAFTDTMDERDGWVFPIYSNIKFDKITDKIVEDTRHRCTLKIASVMSSIASELNQRIDNPSLQFPPRITYYMCRHTFATMYMERGGGNILALASMLGHNVSSTTNYVKELKNIDTLIESKMNMFE